MPSMRDKKGRPIVVATGVGVVTSLGIGQKDNWAKLTAGESGIRQITRFSTEKLKTRIAGTVDFLPVEPMSAPALCERLGEVAAEEAIEQAHIGRKGDFPGPLFLAVAPVEIEWTQRRALAKASGANDAITYDELLRTSPQVRASSTSASSSIRSPTSSPKRSAPRVRRFRSPRRARRARPRSNSASRPSGAARPMPRCASAPTAR